MTTLAHGQTGAITRPQGAGRTILQGEDAEDTIIPRVHIFQGLPAEREQYGPHNEGDLIVSLTGETLEARKFVPIFGWIEFVRFREPRGSGIDYRTRDKAAVPPEDLEFDRANGRPPRCTKMINFAVLFAGRPEPLVLSFKSTSLNAGRTINSLEKMRGSRGPGLYALELLKRKNGKGAWLSPHIRPLGDPSPDDLALAEALLNSLSPESVQTNVDGAGSAEPDFDPSQT